MAGDAKRPSVLAIQRRHWIRCCPACEATGFEPYEPNPPTRSVPGWSRLDSAWLARVCSACGGTGAAPWWRCLLRTPVWVWRGVMFLRQQAGRRPSGESQWSYWVLNIRAAYGPVPKTAITTRYGAGVHDE